MKGWSSFLINLNGLYMSRKLKSYLRTCRLRSGLTQQDLAFLFGLENGSSISRAEIDGLRLPAHILLGYCVIFDVSPAELVPGLLNDIEKTVVTRARTLQKQLQSNDLNPATQERISFLEKLISGE